MFAGIARGTLFKYYDKSGQRLQEKCPVCGGVDALQHLKNHLRVAPPTVGDELDIWIPYLGELSRLATPLTRTLLTPIPLQDPTWNRGSEVQNPGILV